jgi:hypothetical protein
MKKTNKAMIEVDKNDFSENEIQSAIDRQAATSKEYRFKRTYIGMLGSFFQGKKYSLTEEEYSFLKGDVE